MIAASKLLLPYALLVAAFATAGTIITSKNQITPAQAVPLKWDSLVKSATMDIDVDTDSIKVSTRNMAYEVSSNFRINFHEEFDVEGKQKKGAYYVNRMTAVCRTGDLRVETSDVYTKEGELIATGKNLGILPNPKDPKSFITQWVFVVCKDLKDKRAPYEA